jgi:hypothetical protein
MKNRTSCGRGTTITTTTTVTVIAAATAARSSSQAGRSVLLPAEVICGAVQQHTRQRP